MRIWLLVLVLASVAYGRPAGLVDGGLPERPAARESSFERPLPSPRSLLDRIDLTLPRMQFEADPYAELRAIAPTYVAPGSRVLDYHGFEGFLIRKLQSRYRSMWRSQLRTQFREGSMSEFEFGQRDLRMRFAVADMELGRWGDRSWLDAFSPEQGGAPLTPYVDSIGEDLLAFEFGPLSLSNSFQARIDQVAEVSLDPDPGRIYRARLGADTAREHALLQRAVLDPHDPDDQPEPDQKFGQPDFASAKLAFELQPLSKRFLENTSWQFKVRPQVRLRVPNRISAETVVRSVGVRTSLDLRYGARRDKVASLECELRYQPEDGDLRAQVQLAVLTW
ncbi:MAG: hypothetical protein KDD82_12195 [Planctomycetes bacterium]|nr:hypothetical protein [Planctomycetota bacterium]